MSVNHFPICRLTASVMTNVTLLRRSCLCVQALCVLMVGLSSISLAQTTQVNPKTADEYFKRGNDYKNKNDYEQAIADYTEALRLDPRDARAYVSRALAHFNLKEFDKVIADSTQAIKLNSRYAEAYHNRGAAYGSKGNYTQALVDINRAIKLKPRLAEAYFSRGVINNALRNNEQAIADYSRAVKLDPQLARAYFNRGSTYIQYTDYDRAISDYTKTISLMPGDPLPYRARASAYAAKKEYDPAIADLTKAISLAPKDAAAYKQRADVYCAQGEKALAAADEKKIIELGERVSATCEADGVSASTIITTSSSRRFEDYSATQKFTGRPAIPIIANQRARRYRTMIQQDAREGPNFAGHYTIARWGCGSTCVGFAIVDARTGQVYFHPTALQVMQVPYQAEDVLQFRPDSRMLIISGEILSVEPEGSSNAGRVGKFYYEWKNNRFTLLETVGIRREEFAQPRP